MSLLIRVDKFGIRVLRDVRNKLRKKIEKGSGIAEKDFPSLSYVEEITAKERARIYAGHQEGFEVCKILCKDSERLISGKSVINAETVCIPYNCAEGVKFSAFNEALEAVMRETGYNRYLLAMYTNPEDRTLSRKETLAQIQESMRFPKNNVRIEAPADEIEYGTWARQNVYGRFMTVICPPYNKRWKEIVEARRNQIWTYMAWLNDAHENRTF